VSIQYSCTAISSVAERASSDTYITVVIDKNKIQTTILHRNRNIFMSFFLIPFMLISPDYFPIFTVVKQMCRFGVPLNILGPWQGRI